MLGAANKLKRIKGTSSETCQGGELTTTLKGSRALKQVLWHRLKQVPDANEVENTLASTPPQIHTNQEHASALIWGWLQGEAIFLPKS